MSKMSDSSRWEGGRREGSCARISSFKQIHRGAICWEGKAGEGADGAGRNVYKAEILVGTFI